LTKVYNVLKTAVPQSKGAVWKKGFLDAAKPSTLSSKGFAQVSWTDKDVDDIKRTFIACGAFLYFPVYNINDSGIGSVATSQGATMTTNGAPNDLLNNFNPLTIIVFVPILSHVVYPTLRKFNIKFGRISRITFGFCLAILYGLFGTWYSGRSTSCLRAAIRPQAVLTWLRSLYGGRCPMSRSAC